MMGEISFEQISITELCKRAEISRITFYAHYSDKYALADDIFSDMLQIGTDIYRTKQEKENPGNDLVMGYCNMLNSILEVYYDCFAFFQYTSPQKNPYLASAFYTIVLETIENHTNKIRQNVEVKYSPKKIAGFLCFGMLGFINEAHGEKTSIEEIKREANQLLRDILQSGVLVTKNAAKDKCTPGGVLSFSIYFAYLRTRQEITPARQSPSRALCMEPNTSRAPRIPFNTSGDCGMIWLIQKDA